MTSALPQNDDSTDLVRILGRTIMVVNVLVGVFIFFLVGMESGPDGRIWYPTAIWAAIAFVVSGPFAWGVLRGIAQIRDRIDVLVEEDDL